MYHDLARIWFQTNARSQIRTTKDLGWFLPKILLDIFTRVQAVRESCLVIWIREGIEIVDIIFASILLIGFIVAVLEIPRDFFSNEVIFRSVDCVRYSAHQKGLCDRLCADGLLCLGHPVDNKLPGWNHHSPVWFPCSWRSPLDPLLLKSLFKGALMDTFIGWGIPVQPPGT